MSDSLPIVDEVDPAEAYRILDSDPNAVLIDVRTKSEWEFVGLPDLSIPGRPIWPIEWAMYPNMARNPEFVNEVVAHMDGKLPTRLLFICRSGVRSMAAAQSVVASIVEKGSTVHCTNVAEGFEGDIDQYGHRGRMNGWKLRGLPWRQS